MKGPFHHSTRRWSGPDGICCSSVDRGHWSPYLKKDILIRKLEKVQRRATKLILSLTNHPYGDRLKFLGLTTQEQRRTRGNMLETFKMLKGYDKVEADSAFLELDGNHLRARGHQMKFTKPRHSTRKRNEFFAARVVDQWNGLPENVVSRNSINQFKRRYDQLKINTEWG